MRTTLSLKKMTFIKILNKNIIFKNKHILNKYFTEIKKNKVFQNKNNENACKK